MNAKTNARIAKCLDLAVSAHKIGSEHEWITAARRAGILACCSDVTLAEVWDAMTPEGKASNVWPVIVDAWFDTKFPG